MTGPRQITSAQRLAAKALGVALPDVETDPHTKVEQALRKAASRPPRGWSTGDASAVIKASRAAVQARRGEEPPAA